MATKKEKSTTGKKNSSTGTKKVPAAKKSADTGKRTAASAKKTASASKKSAAESRNKRSAGRQIEVPDISRRRKNDAMSGEVVLWVMLAFCIILFLANTFGIGGIIGRGISRCFFGLFGVLAYLMPFMLFLLAAFLVANKGSAKAWGRCAAALLLLVTICTACSLLYGQTDGSLTFSDFYQVGSELRAGGGVAAGILCKLLLPAFGLIATWIINLMMAMIAAVLLTGYSLFEDLGRGSREAVGSARARKHMKKELRQQKKRNERLHEQERMQKKIEDIRTENEGLSLELKEPRRNHIVTGVSTNTTMDPNLPAPEDVHEVVPKLAKTRTVTAQAAQTVVDADQETASLSKARKLVEEVPADAPHRQMGMQFTIQREGSSQVITADAQDLIEEPTEPKNRKTAKAIQNLGDLDAPAEEEYAEEVLPEENQSAKTRSHNPRSSAEEQQKAVESVAQEIEQNEAQEKPRYIFPPLELLGKPRGGGSGNSDEEVAETAAKLQQTLHNFGVNVEITNVSCGPTVTRYELLPEQGVKVSRIVNLADDIKLSLAAADIRIEAPIPGKSAVGIEVPNRENSTVYLRSLLESGEFQNAKSSLSFAVGKDIAGKPVIADIAKMPHLLIAGATGSGKSVCINTLIMSILYKADPDDVKLIMIDPKIVELSVYNGIPHLYIPVVTDAKKAPGALNWGVSEMTARYQKFAAAGVRDIKGYNAKVEQLADVDDPNKPKKMPQIVIIVDELADLMMQAPGEVEDAICRLAQLARAAGIHLIIATQRPSVNVITGVIKANMPSRIAFSVTSGVDSRTILDMVGAEKLLGKGDMLFYPQGYPKPVRVQGSFVSDGEVSRVTDFLKKNHQSEDMQKEIEERMNQVAQSAVQMTAGTGAGNELDSNFVEAGKFIIEKEKASIGMLQRVFKIGFNRAARIMDQLAEAGVVGPEEGTKPRKILMTMEEFEQYVDEYV